MRSLDFPLSPILTVSPPNEGAHVGTDSRQERFPQMFHATPSEVMWREGWQIDQRRDHSGRLFGSLPMDVVVDDTEAA